MTGPIALAWSLSLVFGQGTFAKARGLKPACKSFIALTLSLLRCEAWHTRCGRQPPRTPGGIIVVVKRIGTTTHCFRLNYLNYL